MLGNHDVEMSFPRSRAFLMQLLGKGRVDFIYDNEAFTMGPVLIEHGNRYDAWNAVAHGALRRLRSRMSRALPMEEFPVMPGSRLVIDVMNPIKGEYSFVDLLKPETVGVLPILAALGVGGISEIWDAYTQYRRKAAVDYDEEFEPQEETYIANVPSEEEELFTIAQNIAAGGDATQIGMLDFTGLREEIDEAKRKLRRNALHSVFSLERTAKGHRQAFQTDHEDNEYLKPARAAAKRDFKVIVFGHTHLVKRVNLGTATYLNTGTWADLIRVPSVVWGNDADLAKRTLDSFVDDLEADKVERWRRSAPTYAKILLDGDQPIESETDVFFVDNDDVVSDEGLAQRMS
jgi:UDP-2,3-diacylglucosamine pyrophosphatase LpxH